MMTMTCRLKVGDNSVHGRIEAQSPEAEYPVIYGGELALLDEVTPRPPGKSDAGFLEFLFKGWAAQIRAELEVSKEGEYERYAE